MKTKAAGLPPKTLAAFENDGLRARIFYDKYALPDTENWGIETTPEEMWQRVAHGLAALESEEKRREWEKKFYWLLKGFKFVPGGRVLHAIGNPNKVTALNCYVVPSPHDSIQGIYKTALELAETFKRGGGIGTEISSLRPKNAPARNAARHSTGAVSFMELYSLTTGIIGQQGRRGALMLTISDSHPDVVDFCKIKRNRTSVRYANISVRVTDAFMRAVERDDEWLLHYENASDRIEVKNTIRARELWNELITGARDWAEPGCLFWSTIQRYSSSDRYPGMEVISTNPCGEEPLEPYGDCCLGSINLAAFVSDPFTPNASLDIASLEKAARYAVRFLDNVLAWNRGRHPLPEQEEAAEKARRIGVGIMGLADMLCKLRLRYDSDGAIAYVDKLLEKIKLWAYDESMELAKEKGPFPLFDAKRHLENPFFRSFPERFTEKIESQGLRNVTVLTIPPTGSIAAMAGVTSGIEPIFDFKYIRRSESLSEATFDVEHPLAARFREANPDNRDSLLPAYFVTAHTIDPEKRILMQAVCQKHIDQAISSCLTQNNLILTNKGIRYIDTLCSRRVKGQFVRLPNLSVVNERGLVAVSDFYYNGVQPIYRVILEGRYTIEGTGNHRVLTISESHELNWRRLDELKKREFVVMRKGLELWGNLRELSTIYGKPFVAEVRTNAHRIHLPRRVTKELSRFLGYLLSDGGVLTNGNTVVFTQQKGEVLNDFCRLTRKLFGISPILSKDPRGKRLYNALIHSRVLVRFLAHLRAAAQGKHKRTPLCILGAGRNIVKEFILGLTLDGHVNRSRNQPRLIVLTNLSGELVREVQQFLLNFGIESNITSNTYTISDFRHLHRRIYQHERRTAFHLYVTGENANRFMELIGYAESRKNQLARKVLRKTRLSKTPLCGVVPVNGHIVKILRGAMADTRSHRLYEQLHSLTQHMRARKAVRRDNLLFALEATRQTDSVASLVLSPTHAFKRVKKIQRLPVPEETFDLYVPKGHHYVANGIVSHNTINLARETSADTVEKIYRLAWEQGLKGITVYREGSREGILISERATKEPLPVEVVPVEVTPRPVTLNGITIRERTPLGTAFVTINYANGDAKEPFEVFIRLGKAGSDLEADAEAIGRLLSVILRLPSPMTREERLKEAIEQLEHIGGSRSTGFGPERIRSMPDGIAKALRSYLQASQNGSENHPIVEISEKRLSPTQPILSAPSSAEDFCPNCRQASLITQEGCLRCTECGYKEC